MKSKNGGLNHLRKGSEKMIFYIEQKTFSPEKCNSNFLAESAAKKKTRRTFMQNCSNVKIILDVSPAPVMNSAFVFMYVKRKKIKNPILFFATRWAFFSISIHF